MTLFKKRKNRSTKRRNQRSLTIESLETRTLMAAGPVFSHFLQVSDMVVETKGAAEIRAFTGKTSAESGNLASTEKDVSALRKARDTAFMEPEGLHEALTKTRPEGTGGFDRPTATALDELRDSLGVGNTRKISGRFGNDDARPDSGKHRDPLSLGGNPSDDQANNPLGLSFPDGQLTSRWGPEGEVVKVPWEDVLNERRPDTSGMVDKNLASDHEMNASLAEGYAHHYRESAGRAYNRGNKKEALRRWEAAKKQEQIAREEAKQAERQKAAELERKKREAKEKKEKKEKKETGEGKGFLHWLIYEAGWDVTPKPDGNLDYESAAAIQNMLRGMKGVNEDFQLHDNNTPLYRRVNVTLQSRIDDAIANWGSEGRPVDLTFVENHQTMARTGGASPIDPFNHKDA
ncbi:MAG: hypothetical protein H8E44_31325 [Planctomycetes bacterium]|nr:hypothetical protein [Planctomycetota bacterium]MBL7038497.1 hypothetical protein [Pirellulaceae bacterium]